MIRVRPLARTMAAALSLAGCVTTGQQTGPEAGAPSGGAGAVENTGDQLEATVEYKPVRIADLKPGQRPPISSDEAGWWMMADRAEKQLQSAGNLVRDPEINEYVRDIVCRVAGPYCNDIRVYVVRHPHFNASMMPNGTMVVWTGAMLRARNEAQIAAVLGHEIGHYLRRHTLQKMRDVRDKASFLIFFSMAAGAAGVPVVGDVAHIAVLGSIFGFSRDNEREADEIGLQLMTEAGYDPREASKVWKNLIQELEADEDYKNRSIFFSTHPQSEERRDTLRKLAEDIVAKGYDGRIKRERYDAVVAPRRPGYVRDELHLRRYASLETLLKMMIEQNGEDGQFDYFLGELYRLRKDEGDRKLALAAYEAAIEKGPPPEVYRSMGLIYLKSDDDKAKGRELLARYLQLRPDAADRKMIEFMIQPSS